MSDDHDHDHDHDHGGGPVVIPILPVRSLDEATRLTTAMGLDVERYDDGYAWVRIGGRELWHLRVVEDLDPATNPSSIYVFAGEPDTLREAVAGLGLDPTPVEATPWGTREFAVRDPSGNLIRVGTPD